MTWVKIVSGEKIRQYINQYFPRETLIKAQNFVTADYFHLPSFLRRQESSATRGKMDSRFHGNDVGENHFMSKNWAMN
jgi:hypothetical protein